MCKCNKNFNSIKSITFMPLINIEKIKLIIQINLLKKVKMANIKSFIIFLLESIYDPFINIICEKIYITHLN
jgi:hypothetical protein